MHYLVSGDARYGDPNQPPRCDRCDRSPMQWVPDGEWQCPACDNVWFVPHGEEPSRSYWCPQCNVVYRVPAWMTQEGGDRFVCESCRTELEAV